MKGRVSSSKNMNVILALLAVLFISLAYLSTQKGREGMASGRPKAKPMEKKAKVEVPAPGSGGLINKKKK